MHKRVITIMMALILPLLLTCTVSQPHEFSPVAESELECLDAPAGIADDLWPGIPQETKEPLIQVALSQEESAAVFIETIIGNMSLEEKISQMFILNFDNKITAASAELESFVSEQEVGGYILFSDNITTNDEVKALTDAISKFSKVSPFICIDEEGGTVSRLWSAGLVDYIRPATARTIGRSGDVHNAFLAGETIGSALAAIGVNVDFAPVADVLTNPNNKVIGSRSFGTDAELVSDMTAAFQAGLHSQGIMSAPKHFPGHGNTSDDSHLAPAIIASSADHLSNIEYQPFIRLIGEGAELIMAGHIIAPEVEPDGLPATLSKYFITDVLRGDLGFSGIVCTDAMNMGAITSLYTSAEAAVLAVKAGVDMILMPLDYNEAKNGIIEAVNEGEIPLERISESLRIILRAKLTAGLITL